MKAKALTTLLLLALASLVHADRINDWIEKGCPSPDREWISRDYLAFTELVTNGALPLPRFDSDPGRMVLRRVVNTENLAFYHNQKLPLQMRMTDLIPMMAAVQQLVLRYANEANPGAKPPEREMAECLVFLLAGSGTVIELVNDFLPTIPKDDQYEKRMEGLATMKRGMTTALSGAITSLSERNVYSDESVVKMVQGIRECYSQFATILPDSTKEEFRYKIKAMTEMEKNPVLKAELSSLLDEMKMH
jgi:hypothetical protein